MTLASQCRQMVRNGEAGALLASMSAMLETVGFSSMAREVLHEREFDRLQRYARIIIKYAADGKAKPEIMARFQLLGLI